MDTTPAHASPRQNDPGEATKNSRTDRRDNPEPGGQDTIDGRDGTTHGCFAQRQAGRHKASWKAATPPINTAAPIAAFWTVANGIVCPCFCIFPLLW